MIAYRYKGLTSGGAEVQGVVEAFDKADAINKAKANCRVLVEIAPVKSSDNILNADIDQLLGGGKIKPKKLALLCSQLAIELKAGLPLVRSLQLVAENEQDKILKRILSEVAEDVHAGNGLADSFAKRGPQLPRSFIETVRAGEDAGRLDESFSKLKVYYENSANVSSKVASAMVYPIMLIVVAIVFNAMLKDIQQIRGKATPTPAPTDIYLSTMAPEPTTDPNDPYGLFIEKPEKPEASAAPEESPAPREHGYELVVADVSWTEAAQRCQEMGGQLVTINDEEEFNTVIALAEEQGVPRLWIGCHRVNGQLVWEDGTTGYEAWAKGEPTYVDINDQVAEDYVMLWNNNGWGYNDNRNDPIADYPQWYSGTVGFVCEYGE